MNALQLQNLITIIGAVLVCAAVVGVAWFGLGELRLRAARRTRLAVATPGALPASPKSAVGEQMMTTIRRLGQQSAVRDPAKLSVLRNQLMQAGYFNREAAVIFLGVKAAAMAAATAGVVLTLPMLLKGQGGFGGVVLAGALSGAAMLGPDQVLKARRQKREREYMEGFPDLLDLLVASVEAGLSLDAAVTRVTDELDRRYPNLTIHLRMLVLELRAGRSRKEAWGSLADRLGIDDARALATMLRQAEDMGTSLGETLSVFSQDMRAKRMLRAEEKALALSAKLTVPLIMFIFPCLLGALLLPAAVRLMHVFGKH
ncbi:MAG TPA: type II secretion system F family protein [Phenylobacterium sp.]|uniref:type II secretion system F family protein n=1 Tax=Phenylobacterium sp. TaxID=1871053 RepID=UPI002B488AF0|nr:type II secretion system F family protein [Phenylobacterium sp.]HKR88701.1 type II secretion system F family protein [Phenylobacterium sp.]